MSDKQKCISQSFGANIYTECYALVFSVLFVLRQNLRVWLLHAAKFSFKTMVPTCQTPKKVIVLLLLLEIMIFTVIQTKLTD